MAYCVWIVAVFLNLTPEHPLCPFRIIAGVDCPLCGASHALADLIGGNLQAALGHHRLAPILVALLGLVVTGPVWTRLYLLWLGRRSG